MPFLGSKGNVGPNAPCDKPDGAGACDDCGSPYRAGFRKRILQCAVYPPEVTLCPACYAKREAESIDFSDHGSPLPTADARCGPGKTMVLRDSSHAYHGLGDIGRPAVAGRTEFIFVSAEKPGFLVGNFLEGYGFINVHFPREACREVTADEEVWLSRHRIEIV